MPRVALLCAFALVLLGVAGCGYTKAGRPLGLPVASALPRVKSSHLIIAVMENEEETSVIGNRSAPYTNALAGRYGLAGESFAITHPSLPNYLALTGGSTQGITSDCTSCSVLAPNLVDQLEAAKISWKAYLEEFPGGCYEGAGAGGYVKKHNPFIYYADIAHSPGRCAHLVGFTQLAADLRAGQLPTYAWISPNLCDDGHDCGVRGSDRFLARVVPDLLAELGPHGLLVITWDEGSSGQSCCGGAARGGRVATIVIGPDVLPASRDAVPVDHYGVLATVEESLGLPLLAGAGNGASGRLTPLFARPPRVR